MTHQQKVKKLLEQFNNTKGQVILKKKTSNLFRNREQTKQGLDFTNFFEVLSVNSDQKTADVEGGVTMEKFASETLKHGFIPRVTIELKTITVGGAVSGIAIESSSFKYGLFHQTVEEMEVLVPTGEVIVCSPTQNSDLFYALPNSYGTLGFILRLKIKLIKAKKFVHLKYMHYDDSQKCLADLEKFANPKETHDFVDGVVFGKNNLVIAIGSLSDSAPYVNDYTTTKIYYQSLKAKTEDYLTVKDFLFRWDTDWWWGTEKTLLQNRLVRSVLGRRFLTSRVYMKLFRFLKKHSLIKKVLFNLGKTETVIQDIGIPVINWNKYLDFLFKEIKISPIWLCPYIGDSSFTLFPLANGLYLDFGFWGNAPAKGEEGEMNRLVEKKTFELKGIKSLYSDVSYTEEEFWRNSNYGGYFKVKNKYDPQNRLKDLYRQVTNR